ncbi:hypothetical protein CMI47_04410 [Candidatus Pacearchaeota archaeon]|mgnify:CR=1 FL=1|jgi:hypothetical protein|nr:hypothetical protein [Candidatus Pacearchaeota archaeon]|tara:strand:+ start:2259 stop:2582 length:324 start_codon:yes stop_codon:yes gene_type:complete
MAQNIKGARQFQDVFGEVIPFNATVDPAAFADDESQVVSVTVTGAAVGDFVLVSPGVDMQEGLISATVISANTVEIVIGHVGGDSTDLASSTWYGVVLKKGGAFGNL